MSAENYGKDCIIYEKTIPERKAQYTEYPLQLHEELKKYLQEQRIEKLYTHQAEMFELAREEKNVVITTSTASGKTLSFFLPVVQSILENPMTRAIFVYPTKALAADQYRALQPILEYFGKSRISAGVYDGDTPVTERSRIRKSANIILTNPEMLNGSMLPNHSKYGFDFIFGNLRFVVLDELHTYRGAFGSHMANVCRRLDRICRYYHGQPQFLCSSATIANPLELAEKICGQKFVCVSHDGSGTAERRYCLIQPPKIQGKDGKYYGQESAVAVAAQLLPQLMEEQRSFIAFTRSRRNVEIILKETRDRLDQAGFLGRSRSDQISGYRGGYAPAERKEIEQKMIAGVLLGLVSTNALELGIDIGQISTTVLVGYPGTRASFWQQTGRAGRSGSSCTNYLILEQLPMDQYIALEPDWLFENSSEHAIIDPDNLLIELAHIRAAAAELPLSLDDIALFPDLGETIPVLMNMEELRSQNGRFAWSGGEYPAGEFSMRNIDENQYQLMERETGKVITRMDESQAFREIHPGAVYLHDGDAYQVTELNLESKTGYAIPFQGNYYTVSGGETNIEIIHEQKSQTWERTALSFGELKVEDYVHMYKKLQFHNHQNLGYEQLRRPLVKKYETEGTWLRIPDNIVRAYRGLLQPDQEGRYTRNNHFEGLNFALKNAAQMVTMTEQEDIGVITSLDAMELMGPQEQETDLYFYDRYVGGLGFSEKIYDLIPQVVQQAIHMVSGCRCADGCVACVGDYRLDKKMVLWGLKNLIAEEPLPEGSKVVTWAPTVWRQKAFTLENLTEKWKEFVQAAKQNGESFAAFFASVQKVETEKNRICLTVESAFYADWAQSFENLTVIRNVLRYYVEMPENTRIAVISGQNSRDSDIQQERKAKQEKMARRYERTETSSDGGRKQ